MRLKTYTVFNRKNSEENDDIKRENIPLPLRYESRVHNQALRIARALSLKRGRVSQATAPIGHIWHEASMSTAVLHSVVEGARKMEEVYL